MATPTLRPLDLSTETPPKATVLCMSGEPRHYFVVVAGGEHGGRRLRKGDVVVVGGAARMGDVVVLLASGMGRPRMGRVGATGLLGDAGEPCSAARWSAAGRLLEVARKPPQSNPTRYGQMALWGMEHAA